VIGFVFLGAEPEVSGNPRFDMRNFRMFTGSQSYLLGGDPTNDVERYSCLEGTSPSSLANPSATPRAPLSAAFDSDWRILVSAGPFASLSAGDSLRIAMAMVLGNGFDDMLLNAARAKLLFQGVPIDCDGNSQTPELCPVHWTTPRSVSADLQALQVEAQPGATYLTWHLDPATQRRLRGVEVQRGTSVEGPFVRCTPELLSPSTTTYADVAHATGLPGTPGDPEGAVWYRLALHAWDGAVSFTAAVAAQSTQGTPRTVLAVPRQTGAEAVQIDFTLAAPAETRLTIHDVSGRMVRRLFAGHLQSGVHHLTWDRQMISGQHAPRGLYLVRLEAERSVCARKLVVLEP
jgi:hypothetical protein